MLAHGEKLETINARFPVAPHANNIPIPDDAGKKNGVIAKGSTTNLEVAEDAPSTQNVSVSGMEHSLLASAQANAIA